ncbi:MAG: M20 family metallopeptidase [Candidatus Bathyarchaeia archaeon]|nr:M20 family metallopeptidase [Candidatus Bathyarchaeota archaeon]
MTNLDHLKRLVSSEVDKLRDRIIWMADTIHENPEIGHQEFKASEILTSALEEGGFEVRLGVAGMRTAFTASKRGRSDRPVVGILCEYDALKGLGHACGHNLIGAGGVGAALALSRVLQDIDGSLMVFGTPAEEGGVENAGGKVIMVEEFRAADACLIWHPGSRNMASRQSSYAREAIQFEFYGKAAHAGASPWEGVNALNALLLMFRAIDALRQHVRPDVRIHGIIEKGGEAPNIVPDYASAKFYVRAADINYLNEVSEKVKNCARGAALATGAEVKFWNYANTYANTIVNLTLADAIEENMKALGVEVYKPEEGRMPPGGGSTDVGNVSQVTPICNFYLAIGPETLVGHTPEFRDAARSEKGHEAVIMAAKILAMTALDLYLKPGFLLRVREEWMRAKGLL